jgi:hypothetical protein
MSALLARRPCVTAVSSVLVLCGLITTLPSWAGEETEGAVAAARRSFDISNLIRVGIAYTDIRAGGDSTELSFRVRLAYRGIFIPGLRIGGFYSLLRVDVALQSLNRPDTTVVGTRNIEFFDLAGQQLAWGVVGVGLNGALPTRSSDTLGSDQAQLGPAAGALVTQVPHLEMSLLVRTFFSISREKTTDRQGFALVEPGLTWKLPCSFYVKTEETLRLDWRARQTTVHVQLAVGHAVSEHIVLELRPSIVVVGQGGGNVRVALFIDYVKW